MGQNIVNLFPLPNIPGAGLTNNFIFNGKYKFDETAFETRFDYNITPNDRFFAHYAIATPKATNPSNFPNVTGGTGSGTSSTLDDRVQSLAGDWSHIFNPGLLNDLRAGFIRFKRRHSAPRFRHRMPGIRWAFPTPTMAAILPA